MFEQKLSSMEIIIILYWWSVVDPIKKISFANEDFFPFFTGNLLHLFHIEEN